VREGGSAEAERRRSTWQHSLASLEGIRGRKGAFDFAVIGNHMGIGRKREIEGRV